MYLTFKLNFLKVDDPSRALCPLPISGACRFLPKVTAMREKTSSCTSNLLLSDLMKYVFAINRARFESNTLPFIYLAVGEIKIVYIFIFQEKDGIFKINGILYNQTGSNGSNSGIYAETYFSR